MSSPCTAISEQPPLAATREEPKQQHRPSTAKNKLIKIITPTPPQKKKAMNKLVFLGLLTNEAAARPPGGMSVYESRSPERERNHRMCV